ncbi:CLUMA_CG011342, isoform A [Clunio marinus]|uniref:CLUMA_CG011342, isoform A n=1 Tax=Clunio marinus TaxID=568069 RepID=A0A1J1IDX5_9DIPT|nr:CLUMA_CG011342, isoform A [Clunio marinus]
MFRMGIPNQSAEEQRNQVRRSVRNNFFSFVALVVMIRSAPYVIEVLGESSL